MITDKGTTLNKFGASVIADPITKTPVNFMDHFNEHGVIDLRVFLKNSPGYESWINGQNEFKKILKAGGAIEENSTTGYLNEIEYDRVVYEFLIFREACWMSVVE